jgi:hypothetical protein
MKVHARTLVWLILGGGLVLGVFWLTQTYEWVRRPDTRWTDAALREPLLGLQMLLKKRGSELTVTRTYAAPMGRGTLIMPAERLKLTSREHEALVDWVRDDGGHLIVVPYDGNPTKDLETPLVDPLLALLGVKVSPASSQDAAMHKALTAPEMILTLPDGKVRVASHGQRRIKIESDVDPVWAARDGSDIRIARFELGEGKVTLASSLFFVDNFRLKNADHAILAVAMLDAQPGEKLTWIRAYSHRGLLAWLYERGWAALMVLVVLLALWIWNRSIRFGPLMPSPTHSRQSLAEHIRATGRWLWRNGGHAGLYAAVREAFDQRLAARLPGSRQMPANDLARLLAERTGIREDDILAFALTRQQTPEPHEFVRRIRLLETILAKL